MTFDLIPRSYWRFPVEILDETGDLAATYGNTNGLSIYEDDKNVYVEAAVPGIDPKDIDVTYEKGILWIKGESKLEEHPSKTYYRKATSSFSYRVTIPGDVDEKTEPVAHIKNGIMRVLFAKSPQSKPKKIAVKAA